MANETIAPAITRKIQLATQIRRETSERLSHMSKISGMPKAEIVDRAIRAYEPWVVEAAKVLNPTPATTPEQAIEQPQTSVSANG